MNKFFAVILALFLAGCTTEKIYTKYVYVPVNVPAEYFECKQIKKSEFPDPATLKDDQVAKILKTATSRLRKCGVNATAAKEFIEKANKLIDEKNKQPAVLTSK